MTNAEAGYRQEASGKSLGIAFLIHAAAIGALIMIPATFVIDSKPDRTWQPRSYPIDPVKPDPAPPEPKLVKEPVDVAPRTEIDRPKPPLDLPMATRYDTGKDVLNPVISPVTGDALAGSGVVIVLGDFPIITPPKAKAVFTPPTMDARFASRFQPEYPGTMRRLELSGTVRIRVLVGTDGRVIKAERISATQDDFWDATKKQALTQWRFRPATKGDTKVEAWFTIDVKFELK